MLLKILNLYFIDSIIYFLFIHKLILLLMLYIHPSIFHFFFCYLNKYFAKLLLWFFLFFRYQSTKVFVISKTHSQISNSFIQCLQLHSQVNYSASQEFIHSFMKFTFGGLEKKKMEVGRRNNLYVKYLHITEKYFYY